MLLMHPFLFKHQKQEVSEAKQMQQKKTTVVIALCHYLQPLLQLCQCTCWLVLKCPRWHFGANWEKCQLLTKELFDQHNIMEDRNLRLVSHSAVLGQSCQLNTCFKDWKITHEYTKLIKKLIRRVFSSFLCSDDTWAMQRMLCDGVFSAYHWWWRMSVWKWDSDWNITGLKSHFINLLQRLLPRCPWVRHFTNISSGEVAQQPTGECV